MKMMKVINPATGEQLRAFETHTEEEVEARLALAARAFGAWRKTSFEERRGLMRGAAKLLREREVELARLMAEEMGKPVRDGRAEAQKCALVCDFYADKAEEFLAPRQVPTDARLSMVRHDPLGPILAVMPWNFPLWQVFRFAAPYLMAGDVGLLKHASNTPGCALAIEAIFKDAGFPEGVFQTLLIESSAVEAVIRDVRVAGVTLTGSVKAGRAVGRVAGDALKPCVLELGGSDPFIVLEDADLDAAAAGAARGRLINNGQSCIAAKRFIVLDSVHDAFVERLTAALDKVKMGDPMKEDTDVGPMARADLRDELHELVTRTIKQGATLVRGGRVPSGPGAFYPPTLLTGVTPEMAAAREETFGPVAPVIRARDLEHAIAIANGTEFGLGGSLWTRDLARALEIVPRIESGHVSVNGIVKSDPRLPFGGVRDSGFGRELSAEGILAFVNTKSVWIG
jgi:succinate-semialdehyde dehydrogenase / glutarate-semialdehyde dehydrogenase